MIQFAQDREVFSDHSLADDPLGHDEDGDATVVATRRGLCRVAVVAAEVATRFHREGVTDDPVGWMLAPRRLFGGEAALDACLAREPFTRAVLLHALSMGMDAAPEDFDTLAGTDGVPASDGADRHRTGEKPEADVRHELGLYSAVVWIGGPGRTLQGFHASFARSPEAFLARVGLRFGQVCVPHAVVREGVDADAPKVRALVSPDTLATLLAAGVGSGPADLDVTVVRRSGGSA